jgi:hypothetical protein
MEYSVVFIFFFSAIFFLFFSLRKSLDPHLPPSTPTNVDQTLPVDSSRVGEHGGIWVCRAKMTYTGAPCDPNLESAYRVGFFLPPLPRAQKLVFWQSPGPAHRKKIFAPGFPTAPNRLVRAENPPKTSRPAVPQIFQARAKVRQIGWIGSIRSILPTHCSRFHGPRQASRWVRWMRTRQSYLNAKLHQTPTKPLGANRPGPAIPPIRPILANAFSQLYGPGQASRLVR